MKKKLAFFLTFILLFASIPLSVFGADQITVQLNETTVTFPDATPFVDENNRTLVPLSAIGSAMGLDVVWDGVNRVATFTMDYTPETSFLFEMANESHETDYYLGKETLAFSIGSQDAIYTAYWYDENDTEKATILTELTETSTVSMDTSAIIKESRTYAPVRYLAETFGYTVSWNGTDKIVSVDSDPLAYKPYGAFDLFCDGTTLDWVYIKGGIFERMGLSDVQIASVTINGVAAELEPLSEVDLLATQTALELVGESYLSSNRIKGNFTNGTTYELTFTLNYIFDDGSTRQVQDTQAFTYEEELTPTEE